MVDGRVSYLEREGKSRLAYSLNKSRKTDLPMVVFLHGFKSDMSGTKALFLEQQCVARGQGFLRFDVSGHGVSGGAFEDGTISAWRDDALALIDHVTRGRLIIVGSSMGGWLALLLGRARPERIAGLIGLAAAPDFTAEIYESLTEEQRAEMAETGLVRVPNEYSDEPYIFTQALIEDGKQNLLLDGKKRAYPFPIHLIQGKEDDSVPWEKALAIRDMIADDSKVEITFIDDGDHRLSRPEDLRLIDKAVRDMAGV